MKSQKKKKQNKIGVTFKLVNFSDVTNAFVCRSHLFIFKRHNTDMKSIQF